MGKDIPLSIASVLNKKFGVGTSVLMRDEDEAAELEVLPTGIEVLDHHILRLGGLPVGRILEVYSEEGAGKAQPVDTPIPTPNGWRPLGTLKVGDRVFGVDGMPTEILGVYPQGVKPVYRVSFSDDTSTCACAEHLWHVWTSNDEQRGRQPRIRTTFELANGKLYRSCGDALWRVPVAKPIKLQKTVLPLHPYLLGVLLGDGCLTNGAVISSDSVELFNKVVDVLPAADIAAHFVDERKIRIRRNVRISKPDGSWLGSETLLILRELGLSGCRAEDKFIPACYLWAALEDRLLLLRGLFDTDGHAQERRSCVEYSTASKFLAEAVTFLVRSLGGSASMRYRATPTYTYRGETRIGQPSWRVYARIPCLAAMSLSKHCEKLVVPSRVIRKITSIDLIGEAPCVCIRVASPDGLYITEDFVVTHNSTLGYTFLAAAQRAGGIAALMDSEVSFDPDRAALFGVNNEDLLFSQPDHYDDLVAIVEHTISLIGAEKDIGPSVIVWDSIAATQTKAEFEGGYLGDDRMMARAAAMSKALRVLPGRVRKARVVLVCINQTRDKPGVMFGDKKTTPGGNALKFHASVRIQLFSGKAGKDAIGEHISKDVTVMAVKNRFAPPFRKAKLRLNYEKGWDNEWSVINHAKDKKVIPAATKASAKAYREACKALGWGAGLIIDAE